MATDQNNFENHKTSSKWDTNKRDSDQRELIQQDTNPGDAVYRRSHISQDRIEVDAEPIGKRKYDQWIYVYYYPRDKESRRKIHRRETAKYKYAMQQTKSFFSTEWIRSKLDWQRLFGKKRWLCKVGHTAKNTPQGRIASDIGTVTAFPELPRIAAQFRVKNSRKMERLIHTVLKKRYKHFFEGAGTEWYYTHPDEIKALIKFVERREAKKSKQRKKRDD